MSAAVRAASVRPLPAHISEADFQRTVVDLARRAGWLCTHARPVQIRDGKWATPIQGDAGAPDLLLARDGIVLLAELKSAGGTLSAAQRVWARHIGALHRCWKPRDFPALFAELTAPRRAQT